jgi:formylglycine-generating enzyme required for sulfatase activity
MGSPQREAGRDDDEGAVDVTLPHGMWVMRTEVTQAAYTAVVGKNPSRAKRCDACPVDSVSWDEAAAFAAEVSRREGVTYRLPTEAEWEWAARGAEPYPYAGSDQLERVAWYDGNSGGGPHPACSLEPNAFGLCDMSGNVWEWTRDGYASKLQGGVDPLGAGSDRVVRGGAWSVTATGLRVANRAWQAPTLRLPHVGFRLVVTGP